MRELRRAEEISVWRSEKYGVQCYWELVDCTSFDDGSDSNSIYIARIDLAENLW